MTDNEELAKFIGLKFVSKETNWEKSRINWASWTDSEGVGHKTLDFDDDWNNIMVVYLKAFKILERWINKNRTRRDNVTLEEFLKIKTMQARMVDFVKYGKIEKLFKTLVEFIKWYNSIKNP